MYLSKLKLWNFRKFGSTECFDYKKPHLVVPFQKGLNLLVGENDSGKTAIVDAIKYVLLTNSRDYIRLEIEDFYNHNLVKKGEIQKLRIECYFKFNSEDNDSKAKNFLDWGHFNENGELELRVFLEVEQTNGKIEPYDIRGGIDNEGIALDARARKLLAVTYLKPLRDAKEELKPKKGSRLSQVLDSHSTFADKDNHFLFKTVEFANNEIANFFEGNEAHHFNLLEELKKIVIEPRQLEQVESLFKDHIHNSGEKGDKVAKQINDYLTSFFGTETLSQFRISDTKLKGILERLSLHLDSTNAGLGSHNLLFIAVELLLLEREQDFTGLRLALIEEIEAHLHPQAQMRLVEYLQNECENNMQMLLTTHSPNLASKVKLENLIICQDNYAYPMGSDYTMLEKGDYAFLERFLDVTKANLFFAKGVILVEGDAENLLLPTIAKIIDCDLTQKGVSIVNLGNTAFKRYVPIFLRQAVNGVTKEMDIPIAVITDVDVKPYEYYDDKTDKLPKYYDLNDKLMKKFISDNSLSSSNYDDYSDILVEYESLKELKEAVTDVLNNVTKIKVNSFFVEASLKTDYYKDISLDEANAYILQQKDKKKGTYTNKQKVEYHIAGNWTLEYELALSKLRDLFYAAILMAKKEKIFVEDKLETYKSKANIKITNWITEFGTDKPNEKIAYEIYGKAMNGRNISKIKAITAQIFAEILETEMKIRKTQLKTQIESDPHFEYLVKAIKHATSKS